jgi:hypothetical protein
MELKNLLLSRCRKIFVKEIEGYDECILSVRVD